MEFSDFIIGFLFVGSIILLIYADPLYLWRKRNGKMDHKHERNWTREEYFQHIKEEHPDIWDETMIGGEEHDEKK